MGWGDLGGMYSGATGSAYGSSPVSNNKVDPRSGNKTSRGGNYTQEQLDAIERAKNPGGKPALGTTTRNAAGEVTNMTGLPAQAAGKPSEQIAAPAIPGAYNYTGPAVNFGTAPTVNRTGFEAYTPNTTLGKVSDTGIAGPALDPNSNDARGSQARLLALLENAAQGNGPSAAQSQLRAGTDANINAALAMAASQRGGASAAGSRAALSSMGMANQQQANQAATLRAQEMQAAYGLMGSTAGQIRDMDTKISLANMEKNLNLAVEQGKISSAEAQRVYQTNADALIKEAEMRNAHAIAVGNAGVTQRGQDITAGLEQRGQDITARGQNMQNDLGWYSAMSNDTYAAQAAAAEREKNRIAKSGQLGSNVGAGVGAAAAMMSMFASDERLKQDVAPVKDEHIVEFLNAVSPKFYNYKNEKYGKGRYTGYMAQDIEKTEIGKTIVKQDGHGNKMIDPHAMQGAQLSAMKYIVNALEAAKKGK